MRPLPIKFCLAAIACSTLSATLYGASLPADLRAILQSARYKFAVRANDQVVARNDANRFSARFHARGTTIAIPERNGEGADMTLWLAAYGWGSALKSAGAVTRTQASDSLLTRSYGTNVNEWFSNTPRGLEQGFVIAQRPSQSAGPLRLQVAVTKGWDAATTADHVQFTRGGITLDYAELKVWDASRRLLNSRFATSLRGFEIQVDDAAAVYPVTIDPLLSRLGYQQELTASDAADNDQLGYSVAISADGNTAILGANNQNNNVGAAYVFSRSVTGWSQQQELTEANPGVFDHFGSSVALSGDGNTAVVGAMTRNNYQGAAFIFTRAGTAWTQQQELAASDGLAFDLLGYSVALSGDGSTALVSAPVKSVAQGAAYVFTRSGMTWSQQQKLTAPDPSNNAQFGYSVALSGDGNTALLGAPNGNSTRGLSYVFTRSATLWSQLQELSTSDGAANDQFGVGVALSADATTALFGALNKAYVFSQSGGTWTLQQELTPAEGPVGFFGSTVSLSSTGDVALLGTYAAKNTQGAAYVFTRDSALWSQQQILTAPDAADGDQLGWAVGLSGDGSIALLGALAKNNGRGAGYIFATDIIPPSASPVQSPLPNTSGWNRTDVLITWNWADNPGGSGVDPASCSNSTSSTGEGSVLVSATCNDLAGNIGHGSYTARVDKTGPTITPTGKNSDNTAYQAGTWTNQTVTVDFTCSDAASGVATCPASQVFPASTLSTSFTALDVAGNSSAGNFGPIQIDHVAPAITAAVSAAPNSNGWYNANVTVHFTCQDADSGIPAGACPADQLLTEEGTSVQSTGRTVHDAAGNLSAPSNVVAVAIDKTVPAIVYTGNLGTYGVDQTVTITCTATDALSGVATASCANISGAAYSIGVGQHSYSATACDAAGNVGKGSTTFSITVTFTGVTTLVNRWVTKTGIAANLVTTLQSAQAAFAGGNVNSGDNQLDSFINQVQSQSGKSLTTAQAKLLTQYAQLLME